MPHRLVKRYHTNDPFKLANSLKINLRFESLPKTVQGFYYCVLRRKFIVIDESLSEEWKRFVCAHELAHSQLHKSLNRYFITDHTLFNPDKFELEADTYAIKLLSCGSHFHSEESLESFYNRVGIPQDIIFSIGEDRLSSITQSVMDMKCICRNRGESNARSCKKTR